MTREPLAQRLAAVTALDDPTRRALLEYVSRSAEPVGKDAAAAAFDLPRSTAAFHLDRLAEQGLLAVEYRRRSGRTGPGSGRPAKLYRRADREVTVSVPERHYELAAALLAGAVERATTGGIPVVEALADAAEQAGRAMGTHAGSLHDVLETHGFEPRTEPDGIVVLGGGFEGAINKARGGYELNRGGDRFVEAAVLARRYPDARIVISGGVGELILDGEDDAAAASRLLTALGVAPGRLTLEGKSRNTYENAVFSRRLVEPKPGETWLLVTSASHMPRSMACFRAAGFDITAYPVDYRTRGPADLKRPAETIAKGLEAADLAAHEWVGLITYRAAGLTAELFPKP